MSSPCEDSAGKIISENMVFMHNIFFLTFVFCYSVQCLETNVMDKLRELKMKGIEETRSALEEK